MDALTRVSNILPTGTFLAFQVLAPLATNNGDCRKTEIVLTSITLFLLCVLCWVSCFTDSCRAPDGTSHYGIVRSGGLWNPNFRDPPFPGTDGAYIDEERYVRKGGDYVIAFLSVMTLATISLLTAPVTTCFYPHIPSSIQKTIPVLVGLGVSTVCAFGTSPRSGIGFAIPGGGGPDGGGGANGGGGAHGGGGPDGGGGPNGGGGPVARGGGPVAREDPSPRPRRRPE